MIPRSGRGGDSWFYETVDNRLRGFFYTYVYGRVLRPKVQIPRLFLYYERKMIKNEKMRESFFFSRVSDSPSADFYERHLNPLGRILKTAGDLLARRTSKSALRFVKDCLQESNHLASLCENQLAYSILTVRVSLTIQKNNHQNHSNFVTFSMYVHTYRSTAIFQEPI